MNNAATSKRIEGNRREVVRFTGPNSAAGKERPRFEALKHGLSAMVAVLPDEDEAAFRARLEAWKAEFQPRDEEERCLVERAVHISWLLDRADRVRAGVAKNGPTDLRGAADRMARTLDATPASNTTNEANRPPGGRRATGILASLFGLVGEAVLVLVATVVTIEAVAGTLFPAPSPALYAHQRSEADADTIRTGSRHEDDLRRAPRSVLERAVVGPRHRPGS